MGWSLQQAPAQTGCTAWGWSGMPVGSHRAGSSFGMVSGTHATGRVGFG